MSKEKNAKEKQGEAKPRHVLVGTYKKGQLAKWREELQMAAPSPTGVVTAEDDFIRSRILTVRGVQVMLDRDLATLYGVDAKRLNEQVKRNINRFPENFMFRLSDAETREIVTASNRSRSQIATLNKGRGSNIKYRPFAFTELADE